MGEGELRLNMRDYANLSNIVFPLYTCIQEIVPQMENMEKWDWAILQLPLLEYKKI